MPVRPRVRSERVLGARGGFDRVADLVEDDEKRVAIRMDLEPVVCGPDTAQDRVVVGEDLAIEVPDLVEKPRRALDVAEQHRQIAFRKRFVMSPCRHQRSR
jgi:hypothetical protein